MNARTLERRLAAHARWLSKLPKGERFWLAYNERGKLPGVSWFGRLLDGADLSGVDLSGLDLQEIRLQRADLASAKLSRAQLQHADLRRAILSHADLSYADLTEADLRGANLAHADLTGARLAGANLSKANLEYTLLKDAPLWNTCLSPDLHEYARRFAKECPPAGRHGGRLVYRTRRSMFVGINVYEVGHTYRAPVLSWDAATNCHPGIYAASARWYAAEFIGDDVAECYVRDGDWTITGKGAIRCARIRVLRVLSWRAFVNEFASRLGW